MRILGYPGCQDRGVSWRRPCDPRPGAMNRQVVSWQSLQCRTRRLFSNQREPPAGHSAQVSGDGDRLRHLCEHGQPVQDAG
jgi:hypothetical protein